MAEASSAGKPAGRITTGRPALVRFTGSEPAGQISILGCSDEAASPSRRRESSNPKTSELVRATACLTESVACQTGANQAAGGTGTLSFGNTVSFNTQKAAAKTSNRGAKYSKNVFMSHSDDWPAGFNSFCQLTECIQPIGVTLVSLISHRVPHEASCPTVEQQQSEQPVALTHPH